VAADGEVAMILRREHLTKYPTVFRALTGLTPAAFAQMLPELVTTFRLEHRRRLDRPGRLRAIGGGDDFDLDPADQFLCAIVWLRTYPTQEALGYLFGVSDSTAKRAVDRCLPILEKSGKDTMRLPDPGRGQRQDLPRLLKGTPELAVVVDTFEQRTQRPRRRQRAYYSGKKKAHTLKSQVAVDEDGHFCHVGESRPGRWSDLKVFRRSGLVGPLRRAQVGALGDLAYVGIDGLSPKLRGATPRRKPRGRERPAADRRYNRAFARRRLVVEHALARLRRYQALSVVDRHRRRGHTARVRAAAGLVNRMLQHNDA
jgi:DDE superfamily endonuclease/Helix-turn-helix of DDE superfamily endonuclease